MFVPKSSVSELFGTNIGRTAPYPPAMSPKTPGGTECFGRQRAVRGLGSLFGGIFVTAWFPRRHTQGSAIASRRVRHDRWVQMREHEWPWEGWLSWPPACFHRLPSVGIGMRRRRRHDDIRRLQLRIKRPGWKTSHPGHQSVCAAGRGRKRTRLRTSEICRACNPSGDRSPCRFGNGDGGATRDGRHGHPSAPAPPAHGQALAAR